MDGVGLSSTISCDIVEQGRNSIGQFVDNFGLKMTTNFVQFMFKSNQNLTNYLSHKSRRPKSMEIKGRVFTLYALTLYVYRKLSKKYSGLTLEIGTQYEVKLYF